MSYSSIKDNFSTGVTFLKRRFSSDEEQQLQQQPQQQQQQQQPTHQQQANSQPNQHHLPKSPQKQPQTSPQQQPKPRHHQQNPPQQTIPPNSSHPHHSHQQQKFNPTSMVQGVMRVASQAVSEAIKPSSSSFSSKSKTLLIIDEPHTDWSRLFYGRKILGDFEIRVEQTQFSEMNVTSNSNNGVSVEVRRMKDGQVRTFQPDFALIRQHVHDVNNVPPTSSLSSMAAVNNYKNIILALKYGNLKSINSLYSIYNFLDRPWVFSQLIKIQKKLGKENFPLIDQTYYPNFKQMLVTPQFPVVVKVGSVHSGGCKLKVDDPYQFQDMASVTALTRSHSSSELFINSICDVFIQKIGNNHKAFMRKSLSGNWKANTGSIVLEQINMNEKYKLWVDECSKMFGGLDMVSLQLIIGKDNKEYIIEVNDCTMSLLGGNQFEDYQMVVDLVLQKMQDESFQTRQQSQQQHQIQQQHNSYQQSQPPFHQRPSHPHHQRSPVPQSSLQPQQSIPNIPPRPQHQHPHSFQPQQQQITQSQQQQYSSQQQSPLLGQGQGEDGDTMKHLRKTFAGIFGNV